jgi:hypothetical protein
MALRGREGPSRAEVGIVMPAIRQKGGLAECEAREARHPTKFPV